MASDIVLLLKSEHRRLLALADQASRSPRGMEDPVGELRRHLMAHAAALATDVVPDRAVAEALSGFLPTEPRAIEQALANDLPDKAREVVERESRSVLPLLADSVPLQERRRVGKVYRIRRDARLWGPSTSRRRQMSQSQLYEVARRAGIERRSRMTQAELLAAVEGLTPERGGHS